jgi:hypothetical protein
VPSAAQSHSLVTFLGLSKKVTRLSAGTDGLDLRHYPECQNNDWRVASHQRYFSEKNTLTQFQSLIELSSLFSVKYI